MGLEYLTYFAATADQGFFEQLGIDWTLLVLQGLAFLVLVLVLGKFVYPVFMRIIDERETRIEDSLKAAREAADQASSMQGQIDKQLAKARREAKDIVATAKDEATAILARADEKSKANAEHLLESARDEIQKETIAAKKALHNETIELVALATEKVVGASHDAKSDTALIKRSLEEAKK